MNTVTLVWSEVLLLCVRAKDGSPSLLITLVMLFAYLQDSAGVQHRKNFFMWVELTAHLTIRYFIL